MKTLKKHAAMAVILLSGVANAALAAPPLKQPYNLQGAPAMVVNVDASGHVMLRVWSTGREPRTFGIGRNCLFGGGLLSADNLFPDERVVIWTESGQAGTLPVIIRVVRDKN